jgi:membrane protein implicated in regulation of membrane protease activity
MMTLVYVAFAVLGAAYVLVSMFLGHAHGDASADAGGADAGADGAGHADVAYGDGGHGTASAEGHATSFQFPFFSPLALATLFGSIGAYGLMALRGLGSSETASLFIAVPAGLVTAYLVTYVSWRLVRSASGSSQVRPAQLVGARAEVLTPIPAGGIGEVAAMVEGQRFNAPAREVGGRAVVRGQVVRVTEMVGGTLLVSIDEGKAERRV